MDLEGHLKKLKRRAESRIGNVVAAYEVKKWPKDRLKQLLEKGVLRPLPDADEIQCPGCTKRHKIVPLKTTLPDGNFYAQHLCSKEGLIPIPESLFRQWEIVTKKSSKKIKTKTKTNNNQLLNVRVANVIIKHQNASSPEIAKLVDSTENSVRTTAAWGMRKQLRDRYDTVKGWKNAKGDMDADATYEIKSEHYDIYEMFQKYKSGENPDYPNIERIAEKLRVKPDLAKDLLKEAKHIFEFEADGID